MRIFPKKGTLHVGILVFMLFSGKVYAQVSSASVGTGSAATSGMALAGGMGGALSMGDIVVGAAVTAGLSANIGMSSLIGEEFCKDEEGTFDPHCKREEQTHTAIISIPPASPPGKGNKGVLLAKDVRLPVVEDAVSGADSPRSVTKGIAGLGASKVQTPPSSPRPIVNVTTREDGTTVVTTFVGASETESDLNKKGSVTKGIGGLAGSKVRTTPSSPRPIVNVTTRADGVTVVTTFIPPESADSDRDKKSSVTKGIAGVGGSMVAATAEPGSIHFYRDENGGIVITAAVPPETTESDRDKKSSVTKGIAGVGGSKVAETAEPGSASFSRDADGNIVITAAVPSADAIRTASTSDRDRTKAGTVQILKRRVSGGGKKKMVVVGGTKDSSVKHEAAAVRSPSSAYVTRDVEYDSSGNVIHQETHLIGESLPASPQDLFSGHEWPDEITDIVHTVVPETFPRTEEAVDQLLLTLNEKLDEAGLEGTPQANDLVQLVRNACNRSLAK